MNFSSVKYSFHIALPDNSNLYLTEIDKPIIIDQKTFLPNSGIVLSVEKHHDLVHSMVKIYKCFPNKIEHFVTYDCSSYVKRDLDFTLYLTPYSENYNQSILLSYSKNCQASFGDAKCGINKSTYSSYYNIKEIFTKTIVINNLNKESGYYTFGDV
ncbi:MAG: hypothetical protein RCG15_02925 [Candidatus Rickettsia vulgarisii]